jgi:hypothetical protein
MKKKYIKRGQPRKQPVGKSLPEGEAHIDLFAPFEIRVVDNSTGRGHWHLLSRVVAADICERETVEERRSINTRDARGYCVPGGVMETVLEGVLHHGDDTDAPCGGDGFCGGGFVVSFDQLGPPTIVPDAFQTAWDDVSVT